MAEMKKTRQRMQRRKRTSKRDLMKKKVEGKPKARKMKMKVGDLKLWSDQETLDGLRCRPIQPFIAQSLQFNLGIIYNLNYFLLALT